MPYIGSPAPSTGTPAHTVYPYMLCDLTFTWSNHVWMADICLKAAQEALTRYGTTDIFSIDQGGQLTSQEVAGLLKDQGAKLALPNRAWNVT